ncbi:MAG: Type 1 glutamine amidotransferase-like domain-containing protein [Lachnospiraceae bacterium]|nr:Type 1 glutamine amidotransferase-like domain-containing protein [Lachnospiraceae bacterium]MBR5738804.1 Type 1 glutamine amidotransferase-like domain-containing protein [Lachnospiraceae bacterium]
MGRFAAIGGGTFEETDPLQKEIVRLSGKAVPNILFIGTAAKDSTNPLTSCKKSFKRVAPGPVVRKLSILRNQYSEAEVEELLHWADVIYVCGGDTEFMLERWREYGLIPRLRQIFDDDSAVLSGMSAGAICWFTDGFTDSDFFLGKEDWSCKLIRPGIDLYPAVFCPHYGAWERKGFDEAVRPLGKKGIALEDGVGFFYDNGKEYYLSAVEGHHGYELRVTEEGLQKVVVC